MNKFKKIETGIKDLVIIEPTIFRDKRGYFMENYNQKAFAEIGLNMTFVQDNESKSKHGVLRGLHFQTKFPQAKLIRVSRGEVFDVAVDIRRNSKTFGKWFGVFLSDNNKKQFYIPEGFAHGFLVTSEYAQLVYKCTEFYYPMYENGIIWNDSEIGVDWPVSKVKEVLLSDKDKSLKSLNI